MVTVLSGAYIVFGRYNSTIAAERLSEYIERIIEVQKTHNAENLYVLFLGDLINGEIHFTVQLESREMLVQQVQEAAELLSSFVYQLSSHFNNVYVNGVAGNHSRTSFKDQVLRGNRLDNLIPWYMKAPIEQHTGFGGTWGVFIPCSTKLSANSLANHFANGEVIKVKLGD